MQPTSVDPSNGSLLQDDLLMQLVQPLHMGYPVGPSFMHALNTIVEASTLHDINYFDPLAEFTEGEGLQSLVKQSDLVQQLVKGDALKQFPLAADVDLRLNQLDANYEMIDLVRDVAWTNEGTSFTSAESEARYVRSMAQLLQGYSGIFASKDLTDDNDRGVVPDAQRLLKMGMPLESLVHIEGQNHRLSALQHFSRLLRLNLYTNASSLPNQIGMIRQENSIAMTLYKKITAELGALDEDQPSGDDFATIRMPELSRIVLKNAKGDASAIGAEILELRHKHAALRRYLTNYDDEWRTASNKRQREKLQVDFNNAWDTFLKHERRPRDRLIYKLWGILKNPLQILTAGGDELVKAGRRTAVTGQVRGLHAFWNDLLDAPVAQENYQLVASLGFGVASQGLWDAHAEFGAAIQGFIFEGTPRASKSM